MKIINNGQIKICITLSKKLKIFRNIILIVGADTVSDGIPSKLFIIDFFH